MKNISAAFLLLLFLKPTFSMDSEPVNKLQLNKELIVLSAPVTGDPCYADVADEIFDFHIQYARQIIGRDNALILVDDGAYDRYARELGKEFVKVAPMADIWLRDFGLSNAQHPIMFRYSAEGQGRGKKGQRDADIVQEQLAMVADKANISFLETELLNDGGNFVDDYEGNVVISRKFLRDNALTEEQARRLLRRLINIENVAFIDSDEQGGLEHADGVVAFVDTNTLIINSYNNDPQYAES